MKRHPTLPISIGHRKIGGQYPILVQSMAIASPANTDSCIAEIKRLEAVGCDLIRVAVPDQASARAIHVLKQATPIPLIADIHFDPDLAMMAIEQGIDKIRLNPSNVKDPIRIKDIIQAASAAKIPIRVGANAGSVKLDPGTNLTDALFQALQREVAILESLGFTQIVLSAKCSSLKQNWKLNHRLADSYPYPIHIGLTEAGLLTPGIVQTTLSLSALLKVGIGDTLRFSLSGELEQEVIAGKTLLQTLGLRNGVRVIACPMCGRSRWNVQKYATMLSQACEKLQTTCTVAVMGCEVNGPGEAREADYGLAGSGTYVVYFEKGEIRDKGHPDEMMKILLQQVLLRDKACHKE